MLKQFIGYYKPQKKLFFADMLCDLVVAVCDLFYPMITRSIIQELRAQQKPAADRRLGLGAAGHLPAQGRAQLLHPVLRPRDGGAVSYTHLDVYKRQVLLPGDQQADGHVGGGLLKGVHQPAHGVEEVEVPHGQLPGAEEGEGAEGTESRRAVAQQHGLSLVPAVAQGAGKDAQRHIGGVGADREQAGGEGRAPLLVGPDHQGKTGHGAAQGREGLGGPEDEKRPQAAIAGVDF